MRGGTGARVLLVGELHNVRPVARRRCIARRVIDQRERAIADVVVDGLGHADADQVEAALLGERRDLVGGVHRVVAADVAEVADVVRLENVDNTVEILGLLRAELVAARADRARRRRRSQQGDLLARLGGQIE